MAWDWKLLAQECTGCGICADLCPEIAITLTPTRAYPEPVPGLCTGCLDCVRECPVDAIQVTRKADCEAERAAGTHALRQSLQSPSWSA